MAGACRVDVGVEVDVNANGTGEVRVVAELDPAAVAELGGETPEKRLALSDLVESGWTVDGPTKKPDGGLEVVARHGFDDFVEARTLMVEVAGEEGPLQGFVLSRERGFLKTTTRFRANVDLRGGLGAFTDPDLRAALEGPNGEPLGVDDAQLAQRFGAPVAEMFGLTVAADLPGDVESNARPSGPNSTGGTVRWVPAFGEEATLEATSEAWNVANIVSAVIASASALALAAVVLRRRTSDEEPDAEPNAEPNAEPKADPEEERDAEPDPEPDADPDEEPEEEPRPPGEASSH